MLSGEVQRDLMEADAHQYAWMETVDQRVREVVHREEPDELTDDEDMEEYEGECPQCGRRGPAGYPCQGSECGSDSGMIYAR